MTSTPQFPIRRMTVKDAEVFIANITTRVILKPPVEAVEIARVLGHEPQQ